MVHDVGRVAGPPGFRRVRLAHRLEAVLRQVGPVDLVHAYWGMPAGVVATAVAARLHIPSLVTLSSSELVAIDDINYGLQRRPLDRRAIARMLKRASAVTVPTTFMSKLLAPFRDHSAIVPMGIDTAQFPIAQRADGPPWRIIRVGSINAVKDYPTLLRALAALPDSVTLDIIGEDTLDGAIQKMAAQLGIVDRVVFHGWQPTDRLATLYHRAHLNIVSSRHEASNVTMLEAASTGMATVGTLVGHVADWNPDRAVGVPVADPSALATAISALLDDPGRRQRIADAARRWTLAHDADWTARTFESLYERIIQA
jgi:glycosyltransferase involved in cell wall biosynthesis